MMLVGREAFTLLGFSVKWYGILIALGMLSGIAVMSAREKRYNLPRDLSVSLALWVLPAALICARAYYVAFEWPYYAQNPASIFNLREGGMAIYGGVIGGIAAGALFTRVKKADFLTLADLTAPGLALGQAIGRWGNFFNQEAYGRAVRHASLRFFPVSVYIDAEANWFFATFFYESAWCFFIVAALLWAEKKRLFQRRGDAALWYVILYAAERCVVEGLRTDSLYWGNVRVSQLISAAVLTLCAVSIARRQRRAPRVLLACAMGAALIAVTVFRPDADVLATALPCALILGMCLIFSRSSGNSGSSSKEY